MNGFDFIGNRRWYYLLSTVLIVPGMIALATWGLPLGIDFSGGSLIELRFEDSSGVTRSEVEGTLGEIGFAGSTVQQTDDGTTIIKTRALAGPETDELTIPDSEETIDDEESGETEAADQENEDNAEDTESNASADVEQPDDAAAGSIQPSQPASGERLFILQELESRFGSYEEIAFETIGPTVSSELTRQAFQSVGIASLAIIIFIAFAFRSVPKPASSFRFGVVAVIALIHDVLFLLGMFAILGRFFPVEINAMFVVAALTVIGFSVNDSIVVFDRIREKLRQHGGEHFGATVNISIWETLGRSLNTSFTVLLVIAALLLFGGETIRDFNLALLLGVIIGTYSSIFIASPLLVDWQLWIERRKQRQIGG